MTPPSRKKARPVRKPRDIWWVTSEYSNYGKPHIVSITDAWLEEKDVRQVHAWLGKWLAWRADQKRRKK